MPCQQRLGHIALLPGVDVVGVHQVFEAGQRDDCKTKRQPDQ